MKLLDYAKAYLDFGWSLIPIAPDSKKPTVKWTEFQTRRATVDEIDEWLQKGWWLAVVTGDISGVIIVDDDRVKHGLKEWGFDSPVIATSANKGKHYYFMYDREIHSHQNHEINIDLKAWHSYCLVPPFNGRTWLSKPSTNLSKLKPISDEIVRLINSDKRDPDNREPLRMADFLDIDDGARTNSLYQIACSEFALMEKRGLNKDQVLRVLAGVNATYNPPCDAKDFKYQTSRASRFVAEIATQTTKNKESSVLTSVPETPIDSTKFEELNSDDLLEILGETIKKDEANKIITFLCLLTTYTEDSQFNISFNAPSSTGKSYIPLEIATLFPPEDVREISYASPTAFYHKGEWVEEEVDGKKKGHLFVDLERKILIFIDQQNPQLLERLRSLLSHDKKEIRLEITDKKVSSGIRTKEVIIRGFPSVVFCTAGLKMDEQENTRLILLSPETSQEKLRLAILEKVRRDTDKRAYYKTLSANPKRKLLIDRIRAVKQAHIDDIVIDFPEKIIDRFFTEHKVLRPKHQRDIARLLNVIKAFALLNLWFRRQTNGSLFASAADLDEALRVWAKISESQEYNLPPYVFNLFRDVILVAYARNNETISPNNSEETLGEGFKKGVSKKQIMKVHQEVVGKFLEEWRLRLEILPMLENSGLLTSEPNPIDKRELLYTPLPLLTIVSADSDEADVPKKPTPQQPPETSGTSSNGETPSKYAGKDVNFFVAEGIRLRQKLEKATGDEKEQLESDLAELYRTSPMEG